MKAILRFGYEVDGRELGEAERNIFIGGYFIYVKWIVAQNKGCQMWKLIYWREVAASKVCRNASVATVKPTNEERRVESEGG
jgi:hypothetical protein